MTPEPSRLRARFVGAYYVFTVATGAFILFFHGRMAFLADLLLGISYLAITAFLYEWSASGNKGNGTARPRS
jgi:hypothetical protein